LTQLEKLNLRPFFHPDHESPRLKEKDIKPMIVALPFLKELTYCGCHQADRDKIRKEFPRLTLRE